MAIGIAKTLGFDLINNFERPYFAASVTEFWKRWHISLTRWLTTHVYINLGGNRCSKFRQYMNIMITFLVSGLWHGANWTFVIWGALHGLFQIVEKALMGDKLKAEMKNGQSKINIVRILRIFVTLNLVSMAWIFFRMPNMITAFSFISQIVSEFGKFSLNPMSLMTACCLFPCLFIMVAKDFMEEYFTRVNYPKVAQWVFYVMIAAMILTLGVLDSGQFIYVSF